MNRANEFRWLPALAQLDAEQQTIIREKLEGRSLVYGPAGTGKTVITIYRSKSLLDQGKKIKVFIYTKTLLLFIRAAIQDLKISQDTVQSFYSWVWHTHREFIGTPPSGNSDEMYGIWVDNLVDFFRRNPARTPRFDAILVDEAQDFGSNVADLLGMLSNNVFIGADASQSLYAELRDLSHLSYLWRIQKQAGILVKNHRNPLGVARVAAQFLENSPVSREEFLARVRKRDFDQKPIWYEITSEQEQLDRIAEAIRQAELSASRVGILCINRNLLNRVASGLQSRGIAFQKALSNDGAFDFRSALPTLTTVHSAKGLEFDYVILPFANRDVWDRTEDDALQRRLFFVALTRTKERLYFISMRGQTSKYVQEVANLLQQPNATVSNRSAASKTSNVFDDDNLF